jgi:hypothetical protein
MGKNPRIRFLLLSVLLIVIPQGSASAVGVLFLTQPQPIK